MQQFTYEANLPREDYESFEKNHKLAHLLQSYDWAKIKDNWDHFYMGVRNANGDLVATALVLKKALPGGFSMLYVPRGPILDYTDAELVSFFMDRLREDGKKHKALFAKLDPAVTKAIYKSAERKEEISKEAQTAIQNLEKAGCIHQGFVTMIEESIQPRYVSTVFEEEDWEKNLPKHTKRLIKDADKFNVEIITGHKELLDEFARLVELTEERKGVALRNKDYFAHLLDTYGDDAVIVLAQADVHKQLEEAKTKVEDVQKEIAATPENAVKKLRRLDDQLKSAEKKVKVFQDMVNEGIEPGKTGIAGILSVNHGPVCEMLYAGMDQRFKQFMPQYKAYVENFKWAFDRGCTRASMGGVEGTLDDGLTKFKDNFNPYIEEYIGEFDLPINKLLYKPAKFAYNKRKSAMHQ